ncbi:hypothetical protein PAT3040_04588 [Paenibacillus agaridevorans]|uniref:Uncharacterized protein n=1 Tax=Paenibacillus agaridevorans TaxID=171404 RepID=A0A2R5F266_9BACL|nr:hypothetical protein PAT3040_04588 [Paenibacillus agaridevorans]
MYNMDFKLRKFGMMIIKVTTPSNQMTHTDLEYVSNRPIELIHTSERETFDFVLE